MFIWKTSKQLMQLFALKQIHFLSAVKNHFCITMINYFWVNAMTFLFLKYKRLFFLFVFRSDGINFLARLWNLSNSPLGHQKCFDVLPDTIEVVSVQGTNLLFSIHKAKIHQSLFITEQSVWQRPRLPVRGRRILMQQLVGTT